MKKIFFICAAGLAMVILTFSLIYSFEGPDGFALRNSAAFNEFGMSDPLALLILGVGVIGMAKIGKKTLLKTGKLK